MGPSNIHESLELNGGTVLAIAGPDYAVIVADTTLPDIQF